MEWTTPVLHIIKQTFYMNNSMLYNNQEFIYNTPMIKSIDIMTEETKHGYKN